MPSTDPPNFKADRRAAIGDRAAPGAEAANIARMRWLTLASLLVAAALFASGVLVLLQSREDAWYQAQQSAANLVLALERDISREISLYDLSLRGVQEGLRLPGIDQASPAIRQAALFGRAAGAEDLGAIAITDAAGNVINASTPRGPHGLTLDDRDYFLALRDNRSAGLFISRPFISRLVAGVPSIGFSRRITDADGGFGGVVVGALHLSYFEKLFARFDLGAHGSVTLARADGRMIFRQPFHAEDFDRDISKSAVFQQFRKSPAGELVQHSSFDGVSRLFAYRQVDNLPLIVSVGMSLDEIYAPWRRRVVLVGGVLLLLCGATIALGLLFRRELQRRLVADVAVMESARRLAVMASTDGLTGVANRRSFDLEFDREWRRAMRTASPIALLMLDVDCFKAYNDEFGHQAGDVVLQSVAAAVNGCVRRPGDLVARYGGEEFVVVLPDTPASGAQVIAGNIRAALAAQAIANPGGPTGFISVSIGIAVAIPQIGMTESGLLKQADLAMYEAKHTGRDRAVLFDAPPAARADRAPPALPVVKAGATATTD